MSTQPKTEVIRYQKAPEPWRLDALLPWTLHRCWLLHVSTLLAECFLFTFALLMKATRCSRYQKQTAALIKESQQLKVRRACSSSLSEKKRGSWAP